MTSSSLAGLLAVLTASAFASEARAHISLMSPLSRHSDQKNGPCGKPGSTRGANIATFKAGEKITVIFQETVPHPGHFRISFDADGDDAFGDPLSYVETYSNAAVLLDDIADQAGTEVYAVEVSLPDLTCDRCTLQVIQVMTDKPPFEVGTNDIYYQCADLVLIPDDGTAPPPAGGDSGGCVCVGQDGGSRGSLWGLFILGLSLAWVRKRW